MRCALAADLDCEQSLEAMRHAFRASKFARRNYVEIDAGVVHALLNARYYDSSKGQFISQDPVFWEIGLTQDGKTALSNPQALNSYGYANDNPITGKDPNGRWVGEFMTGRQSWPSFQLELGDASNQLAQNSPAWNYAFNNPIKAGAVTGLVSTAGVITGVDALGAIGAAAYPGVGTAYAAKQLVAGSVYSALTYGTLKSIPQTLSSLNGANSSKPSSYFATALSLSLNVGPTYIGGYTGSLSDVYQFLSMLNQGLTSLMSRNAAPRSSGASPASISPSSSRSGGSGSSLPSAVTQGGTTYYRNSSGLLSLTPSK